MSWFVLGKNQVLMAYHIVCYQCRICLQSIVARLLSWPGRIKRRDWPEITIFISSFNTLWPLKLTLASLRNHTNYQPGKFLFGENTSHDGSAEFLGRLTLSHKNVEVISQKPTPHGLWIDEALRRVRSPYLVMIDSDILFFPGNMLHEGIVYLESNPDCWLLAADRRPASPYPEDPKIHCPEALSTWLFFVRTSLRDQINASFLGRYGEVNSSTGKPLYMYECGALVLEEMREKGLRYDVMPWSMRQKFYHFGNLSWAPQLKEENRYVRMKQYQMRDIKKRAGKMDFIVK